MAAPVVDIVVVGHRGCGKSTVAGHLAELNGGLPEDTVAETKQLAKDLGRPNEAHAWALDRQMVVRERGMTVESSMCAFKTQAAEYTVIDTPGSKCFVSAALQAASQADVALLCVSAAPGEFEAGMEDGGLTKEHAQICYTMGVKQLLVCVTKMDCARYDCNRFEEMKKLISPFLKKVGYKDEVPIVPVCGLDGDNLSSPSDALGFYSGPTLTGALDALGPINRPPEKPLRIPISKVHEVDGAGTVVTGRIETGSLRSGVKVQFAPGGISGEVASVEVHGESVREATTGTICAFAIGDDVSRSELRRGMVVSMGNDPAGECESFLAQVRIMSHPGKIRAGYTPLVHVCTAQVPCEFEELVEKMDMKKGGKDGEKNPAFVKAGDVVMVKFRPVNPLVVETFSTYPALGRFTVRDHGQTIAVGVIKEVTKRAPYQAKSRGENTYFSK